MFLATDDVEEFTAELVGKMEHFEIGHEKVSGLKTVAIKLEVSDGRRTCQNFSSLPLQALYSAWSSGALSLSYLQTFLDSAKKEVSEAERGLATPPWTAVWDRLVPFYFFFLSPHLSLTLPGLPANFI